MDIIIKTLKALLLSIITLSTPCAQAADEGVDPALAYWNGSAGLRALEAAIQVNAPGTVAEQIDADPGLARLTNYHHVKPLETAAAIARGGAGGENIWEIMKALANHSTEKVKQDALLVILDTGGDQPFNTAVRFATDFKVDLDQAEGRITHFQQKYTIVPARLARLRKTLEDGDVAGGGAAE